MRRAKINRSVGALSCFEEEVAQLDFFETILQLLLMNNERIVIPEVLFHPSDIGTASLCANKKE